MNFFETSAYTNQNVNESFMYLINKLVMMAEGIKGDVAIDNKVKLKEKKEEKKKCC